MLKKLSKFMLQYKLATMLTILFTVGEVALEIMIPYLMGDIIDKGIQVGNGGSILKYGLQMLLLAAGGLICGILSGRYAAYASSGYAANLRSAIFKKVQKFSFSNIDKFSTSSLITRITTDVANVQNSYMMIIRVMMRGPAVMVSALILTVLISPKMSLIFFGATLALTAMLAFAILPAYSLFANVFKKYDKINASVQENVKGIRVVKSFVKEDFEITKFDKAVMELYELFVKAETRVAMIMPYLLITMYTSVLLISWFGAKQIVADELTTGQLTSLFAYVMTILMSLLMFSFSIVMVTLSRASAERIVEVLDETVDIVSPTDAVKTVKNGDIAFENVYFTYAKGTDKYVLSDINLKIASGQTIGIIGGTGSSKSSLANLISRLYDADRGVVKVGDVDVKHYDLRALRDNVGVVLQKNELFSGSILENLRWGNENASLEDCIRVCKIASAHDFIESFPDKYETHIEQGGSNVSGGQKQRLCIARALLKNPKIIVFDDSTSAVDTATDAGIRDALKNELPDVTKIIIGQRISSVKDADKIIVMDDGKISGFASHEELMQTNEIYRAVAAMQLECSADFDKVGA